MEKYLIAAGVLTALSGGATEALKRAFLPTRYCALVSLGLGIGFGLLGAFLGELSLYEGVFGGAASGLMASGLYSGATSLTEKTK